MEFPNLFKRIARFFSSDRVDSNKPQDYIDVRQFMAQHSTEDLNQAVETYFQRAARHNLNFFLKKPLGQVADASQQLIFFAHMLAGLKPLPGMTLLDFGAGTCWTTRYFADFKLKVIACDVSLTALDMGARRFAHNPPLDTPFKAEFKHFSGKKLPLPDASVDRICCFDAFHKVPNPEEVLAEFARVLKQGGIVGFSEPGPNHSKTAKSQEEMRNHRLLQNDTRLEEIWPWAQAAGFTNLRVAVFNSQLQTVSMADFNRFLKRSRSAPLTEFSAQVRKRAKDRRLFFLLKGLPAISDSREAEGLACRLRLKLEKFHFSSREWINGIADADNIGSNRWLPSSALFGPVKLGVHLRTSSGELIDFDFGRIKLPGDEVNPGESVEIPWAIQAPARPGDYLLEFDMVSEDVAWFEDYGSKPFGIPISVK